MLKGHIIPLKSKCCPRPPTNMCLGTVGVHCANKMAQYGIKFGHAIRFHSFWMCLLCLQIRFQQEPKNAGVAPKKLSSKGCIYSTPISSPLHSPVIHLSPSEGQTLFGYVAIPITEGFGVTCHSGLRRVSIYQQGWEGAFWVFGSL